MKKVNMVNEISKKTGLERSDVLTVIESYMSEVKNSLSKGENVYFRGFGSFIVKKRAEKKGRIITKNKTITIPEHYIPAFKPAKIFMQNVKENVKPNKN